MNCSNLKGFLIGPEDFSFWVLVLYQRTPYGEQSGIKIQWINQINNDLLFLSRLGMKWLHGLSQSKLIVTTFESCLEWKPPQFSSQIAAEKCTRMTRTTKKPFSAYNCYSYWDWSVDSWPVFSGVVGWPGRGEGRYRTFPSSSLENNTGGLKSLPLDWEQIFQVPQFFFEPELKDALYFWDILPCVTCLCIRERKESPANVRITVTSK